MIPIKVNTLDHFDSKLGLPQHQTTGAAGADIKACFPDRSFIQIHPGERVLIPTGLILEIPAAHEVQVRPRSGLSLKTGLIIPNSPGTIDCDFRGELKVILANIGSEVEQINHGDRIAQIVLCEFRQMSFDLSSHLSKTNREHAGFGSTGLK